MTTERENGRASTEVVTTPADQQGASPASPPQSTWFPLSHGTPPRMYTPDFVSRLDAMREAEGYVVAEVVGDVGGTTAPPTRYAGSWHIGLAGWHV